MIRSSVSDMLSFEVLKAVIRSSVLDMLSL